MAAVLLSPQWLFLSVFVRREGDVCGLSFSSYKDTNRIGSRPHIMTSLTLIYPLISPISKYSPFGG